MRITRPSGLGKFLVEYARGRVPGGDWDAKPDLRVVGAKLAAPSLNRLANVRGRSAAADVAKQPISCDPSLDLQVHRLVSRSILSKAITRS